MFEKHILRSRLPDVHLVFHATPPAWRIMEKEIEKISGYDLVCIVRKLFLHGNSVLFQFYFLLSSAP